MLLRLHVMIIMLAVSLVFSATSVLAHGSGNHVMGTATAVEADRLGVKTKDGKDVTVHLTSKTQFKRSGPAGTSPAIQVGDRVVVEVEKTGTEFTATEVRFSTPVKK